MLDNYPRYDVSKPVGRQHLQRLIWLLSWFSLKKHKNTIVKKNMEGIQAPYLLLANHNAFMDFKVASHALYPARANFVVAIDGFIGREWLMRLIGCICTRKFTTDIALVRQLIRVIKRGDVAAIYPEARYSLCGTTAVLPDSLGKLAKLLDVPVVVLLCHGHHVNSPFYHLPDHGVKGTYAEMTCILQQEEVRNLSVSEINKRIRDSFWYDDYRWQYEHHIKITYPKRAEGLEKVLYQCPSCNTEYQMKSEGCMIRCEACGKRWQLNEDGTLSSLNGTTEFQFVPDWYEWEREQVRREVQNGSYQFLSPVHVDALPNAKGFVPLGKANLKHDMEGFTLDGVDQEYHVRILPSQIYSCHIEYDYLGKHGDCIDLNTSKDTLYIYPEIKDFSVTKIALATEEIYEEKTH